MKVVKFSMIILSSFLFSTLKPLVIPRLTLFSTLRHTAQCFCSIVLCRLSQPGCGCVESAALWPDRPRFPFHARPQEPAEAQHCWRTSQEQQSRYMQSKFSLGFWGFSSHKSISASLYILFFYFSPAGFQSLRFTFKPRFSLLSFFPVTRSRGPNRGADVCWRWAFPIHPLCDQLLFCAINQSCVSIHSYGIQLQPGQPRGSLRAVWRTHPRLGNSASDVKLKNLQKHFMPSWRPRTDDTLLFIVIN